MRNLGYAALVLAMCATGSPAQQVWKVDCTGAPGSHFTDLPPAVAAAAPGDTILAYATVGGGCAAIYTAPVITKPLRIVGFFVGLAPGNNHPTQVQIVGPLHISNSAAGEQLLISNVYIRHQVLLPPWGSGGLGSPITVTDCDGSVLFEDLYFDNLGTPGQVVRIERCDHVVLRGCTFWIGGDPIRVIDSNVLLSTFLVQFHPPSVFTPYTTSTEALFLQRSTVTLVGSIVEGPGPMGLQPARNAALLDYSTLRVGATSLLRGGRYAGSPSPPNPWNFAPAYNLVTAAPSTVEKDPRAPVFNFYPAIAPTITAIDETFHDWVVADEWYNVRVLGPINGFACLAIGNMMFPGPSPWGTLGLDPFTAMLIEVVPLPPPSGVHTWSFFCPSWVPNGFAFCFQSLTLSPTGVFGL
ncbi:MAG: hypothetical protein ABIP94_00735, partial [Planctomycetota bacterium]